MLKILDKKVFKDIPKKEQDVFIEIGANQMKDLFNISPTISEHTDNDGDHYPNHWSDHVWSDDPKAWRSKND